MKKNSSEILFEYLRRILYDSEITSPDLNGVEESYQGVAKEIQLLHQTVQELCTYIGNPTETFVEITRRIAEKYQFLREENRQIKKRAENVESYNELMIELTRRRREWILVVDAETNAVMYCNKRPWEEEINENTCRHCDRRLPFHEKVIAWHEDVHYKVWEYDDADCAYRITTFLVEWRHKNAYAHIISDITSDRNTKQKLEMKAYVDQGTGIYNRRYFEETMARFLKERRVFTLCYLDLDGLKYANDNFGHLEGDRYIQTFVSAIQSNFRSRDIFCRVGGDEFALILQQCPKAVAEKKIAGIRQTFEKESPGDYPAGFSYGLVHLNPEETDGEITLEKIITEADQAMYEFKRKNKRERLPQAKEKQ